MTPLLTYFFACEEICEGQGNGPQAQRYYAEDLRRHSQKETAGTYDL